MSTAMPETGSSPTAAAEPRDRRGLVSLLAAYGSALTANRVLAVAMPWFVLTTTGSITKTGLVAFCQVLPYVIFQALSGPLIDRIGPKRISVTGDLVSTTATALAPLLYLAGMLSFPVLLGLMAVVGMADGPANGAKGLFVPSATRKARVPIERGTGLSTVVERSATTVGPAIAGVVVALFGSVFAFWATAALFALSALIVSATLTDPVPEPHEQPVAQDAPYLTRLREGADFLRGAGLLRSIVVMLAMSNLLDQAFMSVLLPVWAKASGAGPEAIGLVVSVFAATSIIAAVVATGVAERLPRRTAYLVGFFIGGVPRFIAMAAGVPMWGVLAVLAIGGLGSGFVNPIVGAVCYELIPTALLGRVKTLAQAVTWAGIPFGGLFGAGVVAVTGLTGALWVVGGLYAAAVILPGLSNDWSGMRKKTPAEAGAVVEADAPDALGAEDAQSATYAATAAGMPAAASPEAEPTAADEAQDARPQVAVPEPASV